MFWNRVPVSTDTEKVEALLSRGVAEAIVREELKKKLLSGRKLRVKLGIDPTSPNLHIGRSIPLLKLRDFQELGHTIVLIVGDFTATIGDTSDKDAERPMLSPDVVERNKRTYFEQAGKLLDLSRIEMRYNSGWLKSLDYRQIGEHADLFSVSDFIARENISRRLDAGKRVSLRELLYPLMQGYDSVAVKADVEIGGTDQKFNVLAGRPLQQHFGQPPQDVLLNPLIDGLDGTKMSSSKGNTVDLNAPPSDMYGKLMSMTDTQVPVYLELCTRIPVPEIAEILKGHPKEAKMRLAREIVHMYHGEAAAAKAEAAFAAAFSKGGVPDDVPEIVLLDRMLAEVLIEAGIVSSKTDLRRLLADGAVRTVPSDEKISDLEKVADGAVLRIGKHRFVRVRK